MALSVFTWLRFAVWFVIGKVVINVKKVQIAVKKLILQRSGRLFHIWKDSQYSCSNLKLSFYVHFDK